jgi:hypothetical protein
MKRKPDAFDSLVNRVFNRVIYCHREHKMDYQLCAACRAWLKKSIVFPVLLSETEVCALFRQLDRHFIPQNEGRSGPVLQETLRRLRNHVGRNRHEEYVSGDWPTRLKV